MLEQSSAAWKHTFTNGKEQQMTKCEIDNGAISSVIQTTNGSRVPSSRPRTDVRPNGKDTRTNAEHKVERKR